MKALLVNYCYSPEWLKDYPEIEPLIYDRSDDGVERNLTQYGQVIRTPNLGNVDYDKLMYLVENYHDLPEVFLWGKSNLFKYISKEEFDEVKNNTDFTPLLTKNHPIYLDNTLPGGGLNVVSDYRDGMYCERYGIVNTLWRVMPYKNFRDWVEWCKEFNIKNPGLIPFPPGGNFILTRERVHRYGKDFYERMASTMNYATTPVEAQFAERSYFLLWR